MALVKPSRIRHAKRAAMIIVMTMILEEMAANVISSTKLGPRVAVEMEPNVCVVKSKSVTHRSPH